MMCPETDQQRIVKSLISPDTLAGILADEYGLEGVRCQLHAATVRDVYRVDSTGARHILYVYRHAHRSRPEVRAEWRFVAHLDAHGLPVAPAMANVEGEFLLALDAPEGERLAVLTPFLPGRLLRERPDSEAIRAFGQVIARIHRAADEAPLEAWERPKVDARDQIEAALDAFRRELPDLKQEGRTLQACAARLLPLLELDVGTTPEYGMIHGDVIRANALVDDDGGVSVLDLDFCGPGWRAYDVASFLSVIRGEAYEAKAERAFLEGYAAVRLLTPHERRVLPVFEAASAMHSLGVSARYAGFWGRAYVDAYLPMKMARLARAMERLPQR